MRTMKFISALALAAMASSSAWAQGTITSGTATFVRNASGFDTSPSANFTGVTATATQDHVFETGWWFRVQGDTAETVFPVPTTQNYAGASSNIVWTNVAGRNLFNATEVSTVAAVTPGPAGTVTMALTVTNTTAAVLNIDIFHFVDLDIGGTAGTDIAAQPTAGVPLIRVTDGVDATVFGEYTGTGATAFLNRPFGATDVAAVLSDTAITNFDNTTIPFPSGDITSGMQWAAQAIPANGSRTFTAIFSINTPAVGGGGPGATPPIFAYNPAAGGPVAFTGGTTIGTTGNASIAVTVATAGTGTGAAATTTTTCTAPAGFTGFAQSVSAVGTATTTTGGPLTGSCVLGASAVNAVMTCQENRGGTNTARTFNLTCPAGTAVPLTSNPLTGATINLPTRTQGSGPVSATIVFTNPGTVAAAVTCTAPASPFLASPLTFNVPANNGTATVTVTNPNTFVGSFTGTLNCTAGAQNFSFPLAAATTAPSAIPAMGEGSRILLLVLLLGTGIVATTLLRRS